MSLLQQTLLKIAPQDLDSRAAARTRLEQLTMPHWALGRLMDLAEDLAGMTRSIHPPVSRKTIVTMAADHGVSRAGVSKYPREVTAQMVYNFVRGGAGINALAKLAGARVVVVDMGVDADLQELARQGQIISRRIGSGTANLAHAPAMTREQATSAIEAGIETASELAESTDLFGTGDMGIGNTTPSSAIVAVLTGSSVEEVTGRGTGINDTQLRLKREVIENALKLHQPVPSDPIDVLAKVGGFEIGGIAGLILGAAAAGKPVLVDGFISTAGALLAQTLAPVSAQYMIAAHRSVERGHSIALNRLGKEPLLDFDLRLGEGTGAALAMHHVEAAVRILTEVATFAEASVSQASSS